MSGFLLYSDHDEIAPLLSVLQLENGSSLSEMSEDTGIIIQWGNPSFYQKDTHRVVLNSAESLTICSNHEIKMAVLKMNGLPVMDKIRNSRMVATVRRYFVPVFQLKEIALYRSKGKRIWYKNSTRNRKDAYEEIECDRGNREIKKVLHYAIQSIYALGLDFGAVLIGVDHNHKVSILDITPTPKLNLKLAEKFAESFHEFVYQWKLNHSDNVVLGADPEFVLRNGLNGKIVLASQFFSNKGTVGCDSIWIRNDQTRMKKPLAELRPHPSSDPRELTINIYKSMLIGVKKINRKSIEWLAGGLPVYGYPIGGHVHFSNIWLNSKLLRALDNYLTLPFFILESRRALQRRPKYGYLGDFREQFHGGFEYRTLSSWLITPRLTKAVFALSKLIALSYKKLSYFPLLEYEVQKAFYDGNKDKIYEIVPELFQRLESLPEYETYKSYITPFKEDVLFRREWNELQDIRPAWRLPPFQRKKGYLI